MKIWLYVFRSFLLFNQRLTLGSFDGNLCPARSISAGLCNFPNSPPIEIAVFFYARIPIFTNTLIDNWKLTTDAASLLSPLWELNEIRLWEHVFILSALPVLWTLDIPEDYWNWTFSIVPPSWYPFHVANELRSWYFLGSCRVLSERAEIWILSEVKLLVEERKMTCEICTL